MATRNEYKNCTVSVVELYSLVSGTNIFFVLEKIIKIKTSTVPYRTGSNSYNTSQHEKILY